MKRWLLLFGGILLILAGIGACVLGAGALSLFNDQDSVSTPAAKAQGPGAAMLIENISVDASSIPLPHSLGTLALSASSPTGRTVFLGAAPADSVDTYLTGAPYDVVVELTSGGKVKTRPVPGTQTPPPPNTQQIWTQQSSGANPSISALVQRDNTVVLMNSDGSTGVTADLVVSLRLPGARRAGWISVGIGALLIALGALALWRSAVARRRALAPVGAHAAGAPHVHDVPVNPEVPRPDVPSSPAAPVAAPTVGEPVRETPAVETPAQQTPAEDPSIVPPWVHVEEANEGTPLGGSGASADDSA